MSILKSLSKRIQAGSLEPKKVVSHYLSTIKQYNPLVNAFVHLEEDADSALKHSFLSNQSPFKGIPIAIKDNICTTRLPTSCCSKMLENYLSPFNATVVDRLLGAGFVPLGKANMDEFAMGSTTSTGMFGPANNPWNLQCSTGGSSGGSAAAVAARMVPVALGSDTGGSVRAPAHFCGIVGMKPSYGAISRYGLVSYASSLDQIGVFSNYASDAAYLLDVIGGKDPNDQSSHKLPRNFFTQSLEAPLLGLSLGVDEKVFEGLDLSLQSLVQNAIEVLKHAGMQIVRVKLPDLSQSSSVYYILASAEASTNLARYDGIRYGGVGASKEAGLEQFYVETRTKGFGKEVRKRIAFGNYCLRSENYSGYFEKAQRYRNYLNQSLQSLYATADCIIMPTVGFTADSIRLRREDIYFSDIYNALANLSGAPAISFPIGFANNLPFGAQLITKRFKDPLLLNIVHTYQLYSDFHLAKPPIAGRNL